MIPPSYPASTPSGEKWLFDRLANEPGTEDWIVLHSLDLRNHSAKAMSECDFVVIMPYKGIACLEVKGCNVTRNKNGVWDYGYVQSTTGPFKQASSAMFAVRQFLLSKNSLFKNVHFSSAVVFTHQDFELESTEWSPWEVLSKTKLRRPISTLLAIHMQESRSNLIRREPGLFLTDKEPFNKASALESTRLLRPHFEIGHAIRAEVEQAEEAILAYTEEQFDALDQIEINGRLLFDGLAGTGKTILAIEAFRRAVREGKRVLFLCFNKLLAEHLFKACLENSDLKTSDSDVLHMHKYLQRLVKLESSASMQPTKSEYFETELPKLALERILDSYNPYDLLILDEAQDLMSDAYLDVLDASLRNGLSGGRWIFFGDFRNQNIFGTPAEDQDDRLFKRVRERSSNFATMKLSKNCRNLPELGRKIGLLCGLDPGYSGFVRSYSSGSLKVDYYRDANHQLQLIQKHMLDLMDRFPSNSICVLTGKGESSAADSYMRSGLKPGMTKHSLSGSSGGPIHHTIQGFKGLECNAAIITDIQNLDSGRGRMLLYTGISRAKQEAILLLAQQDRVLVESAIFKPKKMKVWPHE